MPQLETPIRRTDDRQFASEVREPRDTVADIPPAFYRDAGEPPPGDPHWREWPNGGNREPVPRFLLIGIPLLLGVLGVLHILVILVVLRLSGLY
ncbi:MAG TPA: hypothetical protein VIJ28_02585 [Chloroflexota bacterium]|jgi:hypothetical protein